MRYGPCRTGKKKYMDYRTAQSRADRLSVQTKECWSAYQCKECTFYHIGHDWLRALRLKNRCHTAL